MQSDPAYLLEAELAVSDPALRRKRGVYLTPRPVASYLVRSVDRLLRSEFDLPQGLSTPEVRIIDPACGSGVFLREVLCSREPGAGQPDLLGFDVLPEACAAARRVLGEAARIFELDPLAVEEAEMERLLGVGAACRAAPQSVPPGRRDLLLVPPGRRDLLVLLGNPPWANFGRQNRGKWILDRLADYKEGLAEKKNNLGDDFIKFIRWGQYWLDRAGSGMLAFVTSNTYLGGLTHRAMRRSLLGSFSDLYLYNLHGSSTKQDRTEIGTRDENVFDIRSGVALCILVKRAERLRHTECACYFGPPRVHYAELRGTREDKLKTLAESDVSTTTWTSISPAEPMLFFVPGRGERKADYETFLPLDELFGEYISGVQTKNDKLFTDFSREELAARMETHLASGNVPYSPDSIVPYMLAPFDVRWIYYEPRLLGRARFSVLQHMLRPNLGLVFMRQSTTPGEYDHFLAVRSLVSDRVFHSAHGAPFLAPLYLYNGPNRTANLRPEAVRRFAEAWGLRFLPDGHGDMQNTFGPEEVFNYVYAVVHGTEYRRRFDGELRIGFPRVPIFADRDKARRLCELGGELVRLHAGAHSFNPEPTATAGVTSRAVAVGSGLNELTSFDSEANVTERHGGRSLQHVLPADVPAFRLGGYDVLRRWVKQRQKRPWTSDDTACLESLVEIARETDRLRQLIDTGS